MPEISHLLDAAAAGERQAAADLLRFVSDELRKLAAARIAAEKPGHTLDATGLVHEAGFPVAAKLVKMRFRAGMTQSDAAEALGIPRRTADHHWKFARAWLADSLGRRSSEILTDFLAHSPDERGIGRENRTRR